MSYTPKIQVVDTREFAKNLLAHIEANQEDALDWASDGDGLAPIAKFFSSAAGRITTSFPCLMVKTRGQASDTEDTVTTALSLDLELMVAGRDADTVVESSTKYAMAVESLIRNARVSELLPSGKVHVTGALETLETSFDVLRGSTTGSSQFMQITEFRATFVLTSSAH